MGIYGTSPSSIIWLKLLLSSTQKVSSVNKIELEREYIKLEAYICAIYDPKGEFTGVQNSFEHSMRENKVNKQWTVKN